MIKEMQAKVSIASWSAKAQLLTTGVLREKLAGKIQLKEPLSN
jgi:hypothetical protein